MASYSPLWGAAIPTPVNAAPLRREIARRLNRRSMRKDRELMVTLLGAAAGSAALDSYVRVAHSVSELGGVRGVETITLVDRNTAAADDTDLTANILAYRTTPTTYPVDASLAMGRPHF